MKNLALAFYAILSIGSAHAACDLNDVDLADGEDTQPIYTIVSTKDAVFKDKDQYENDMGALASDFAYADCKDSMIWQVLKVKKTGSVYVALRSDEDDCDGGNSYGVLFSKKKPVGKIEDSMISCK